MVREAAKNNGLLLVARPKSGNKFVVTKLEVGGGA